MATAEITPGVTQLFPNDPQTTDSPSLAFRTDKVKNAFNRLAVWLKGDLGGGTLKLQTLKPGIKIGSDVEADWTDTDDPIVSPDELLIEYVDAFCRLNLTGATAATLEAHLRRNDN